MNDIKLSLTFAGQKTLIDLRLPSNNSSDFSPRQLDRAGSYDSPFSSRGDEFQGLGSSWGNASQAPGFGDQPQISQNDDGSFQIKLTPETIRQALENGGEQSGYDDQNYDYGYGQENDSEIRPEVSYNDDGSVEIKIKPEDLERAFGGQGQNTSNYQSPSIPSFGSGFGQQQQPPEREFLRSRVSELEDQVQESDQRISQLESRIADLEANNSGDDYSFGGFGQGESYQSPLEFNYTF